MNVREIARGSDVYGSDGKKAGDVAEVQETYIVVSKGWLFTTERYVPVEAISRVDEDGVHLNVSKDEMEGGGWDKPPETTHAEGGKQPAEDTDRVSDTVRREQPPIQREGSQELREQMLDKMFGGKDKGKDIEPEQPGGDRPPSRPQAVSATPETPPASWEDEMPRYRRRWEQRYGARGRWEEDEPSYRYGWERANDPRYRGRSWVDIEPQLRRDWEDRHRDRPWDRAADRVRDAWEGATSGIGTGAEGGATVQLREEEIIPHKEMVEAGEAEIRKEIVTETETIEVPVSREELVIERRAADRPEGEGEGETLRVPVREEQVSVEKRPVVYEEVEVGKQPVRETERVSETVRREEPRVEREATWTSEEMTPAGDDTRPPAAAASHPGERLETGAPRGRRGPDPGNPHADR